MLHVTGSCALVIFANSPACLLCILCLLFPDFRLLLILSQLLLYCAGNLACPRSCLFLVLDCVARVDTSVSMRDCTFASHLYSNLFRAGELALTNPGPPSSHAAIPNVHRSTTVVLVPGMAMIFDTHWILELTYDVSTRTKWRPRDTCAPYNSHRNSM